MDRTTAPEQPASAQVFSFNDMGLRVGMSVNMRPRDTSVAQVRHQVEFIGALRGKSFLVTLPVVNDKGIWMKSGQDYVFHVMEGMHVYAFTSRVLVAPNVPYPYVHFSYPDKVEARQVRKSYRVRMNRPVRLAAGDGPRQNALLLNLSMTGALVESPAEAWKQDEKLNLVLPIVLDEVNCELVLHGTVRGWEEKGKSSHYGLEFDTLGQQDALFLHYFIDHTMAVVARP